MSKKNKLVTRRKAHADALQREKEAMAARAAKLQKEQLKVHAGVKKPTKVKRKAIRIRKGVVVRGIKVKDADSKKKVRELLRAERESKMQVDDEDEWVEATDADLVGMET